MSRSVVLVGESSGVTLDANADFSSPRRILLVAAGVSVEVHNLTLIHAYMHRGSDPGGGAVSNAGSLRMSGCTLSFNHAFSGAAIFSSGQLWLSQCHISSNNATLNAVLIVGAAASGGTASAWVHDCQFEGNHAGAGAALGVVDFATTWVRNRDQPRSETLDPSPLPTTSDPHPAPPEPSGVRQHVPRERGR